MSSGFDQVTLVVNTFDGYSVCWPPFIHGLRKYWPTHPEVVFITNVLTPDYGRCIQVNPDRGWSGNLLYTLQQIRTKYVIYAQEDYWIDRVVGEAELLDYIKLLDESKADYIRLYPLPPPDKPFPGDARLGIVSVGAKYRTSSQMALWRREVLMELLDPSESGWDFEMRSVARSEKYGERFLSVARKRFGVSYVSTAVEAGRFVADAFDYAQREGITVDFQGLPKKVAWRFWLLDFKIFVRRIKKKFVPLKS